MKKTWWMAWFFLATGAWATPEWPREVNAQVCGLGRTDLIRRLGATDLETMQVAYYDTRGLELAARALNVRLRIKQDEAELTVKWRAETLPATAPGAECEVDVYRGRVLSACSWNQAVERETALAVLAGRFPVSDLLNADQKALLKQLAPEVSALWHLHGPVQLERWKIKSGKAVGKKWRLERWSVGQQLLLSEVSFSEKKPLDTASLSAELINHLQRSDVTPCTSDEPKTNLVLRHFQQP